MNGSDPVWGKGGNGQLCGEALVRGSKVIFIVSSSSRFGLSKECFGERLHGKGVGVKIKLCHGKKNWEWV